MVKVVEVMKTPDVHPLKDWITWITTDNNTIFAAVKEEGDSDPDSDYGICQYCYQWFDNWFTRHERCYCKKNPDPDTQMLEDCKGTDNKRLGRHGYCSLCDKPLRYWSFSYHKKTNKKANCSKAKFIDVKK